MRQHSTTREATEAEQKQLIELLTTEHIVRVFNYNPNASEKEQIEWFADHDGMSLDHDMARIEDIVEGCLLYVTVNYFRDGDLFELRPFELGAPIPFQYFKRDRAGMLKRHQLRLKSTRGIAVPTRIET